MTAAATGGSVLVVDSDDQMRHLLRTLYELSDWNVLEASTGQDALRILHDHHPDVVVLDVGTGASDGGETLSRIREMTGIPVLVLTGQTGETDTVRGLRAGVDDHVTKPFAPRELLARTETMLRRGRPERVDEPDEQYHDAAIAMDFRRRLVSIHGSEVSLTPLEFRLLSVFLGNPNHVLSAGQLRELAWGHPVGTTGQVKVYVGYLRRKLGVAAGQIETARGFGYRFRPAAAPVPVT